MTTMLFDRQASAVAETPEKTEPITLNRREFLTYAWGMAATLFLAEAGADCFSYLYPRFRVGEFGGQFNLGATATLPATDAAPIPNLDGKFWLVNTAQGPKALYMVCTHLGCLYKWDIALNHFKCPCHNSEYSREGDYIAGPTSRSLDQFVVEVVEQGKIVAQTTATPEGIRAPNAPNAQAEIVVHTGQRIMGQAASLSPARRKEV
ncbi:MAG: Rieske 2Fe-2S domain-containing protein [Caldilineaceae bacterium]